MPALFLPFILLCSNPEKDKGKALYTRADLLSARYVGIRENWEAPEARSVTLCSPLEIEQLLDHMDYTRVTPCGCDARYVITFRLPEKEEAKIFVYPHGWNFKAKPPFNQQRSNEGRLFEYVESLFQK